MHHSIHSKTPDFNRHVGLACRRAGHSIVAAAATIFALSCGAAHADGVLDILVQKLRPAVAEDDIEAALALPFYWKLVDGPTQRGFDGVKSAAIAMPAIKLPFRVATGLPTSEEWVQWLHLAEPFVPRGDEIVNELFPKWRTTVLSLGSKATPADLQTQALLRAKRSQVFTLADVGSTPGDGRREVAVRRYQAIARSLDKSRYFSAVSEADSLQHLIAYKVEQKMALVRQMSAAPSEQLRSAQRTAYQALYGESFFEPTSMEQAQYGGLLAVLSADTLAKAERAAAEYQAKLDAIGIAAEAESRQLAPFVSAQGTMEVLRKLIAVDVELQRSLSAWQTRPSSRDLIRHEAQPAP